MPTNGDEPPYNEAMWNRNVTERKAHNCYAYFLQDFGGRGGNKQLAFPQPGSWALQQVRRPVFADSRKQSLETDSKSLLVEKITAPYSCSEVVGAVLADNPAVFSVDADKTCPRGHYKGFVAVDPTEKDSDFHFWIQNRDGKWSHKPGSLDVTRFDSAGNSIVDPVASDRGRYSDACTYMCVPTNEREQTFSKR